MRTPTDPPVMSTSAQAVATSASVLASSGMTLGAAPAFVLGVLDRHETELVTQALDAVTRNAPADAEILKNLINELTATQALLDRQRPLRRPTQLGGEPRNEQTLMDHLCTIDGLSGDLAL